MISLASFHDRGMGLMGVIHSLCVSHGAFTHFSGGHAENGDGDKELHTYTTFIITYK